MRRWLPVLLLLTACGGGSTGGPAAPTSEPPPTQRPTATRQPTPTPEPDPAAKPDEAESADPRWRFFASDRTPRSSPWFAGRHRVMIGYGCTDAPYYDPDPACPRREGFHHGIDIAMPCGTPLFSAVEGVVLPPGSSGSPGPAYGERPFRIRTDAATFDVLIGHARQVFVQPGDRVRRGQRVALASDSAAPDGCHLHFEVRRPGGAVDDAVDPSRLLQLS